jgi:hypothetical protein
VEGECEVEGKCEAEGKREVEEKAQGGGESARRRRKRKAEEEARGSKRAHGKQRAGMSVRETASGCVQGAVVRGTASGRAGNIEHAAEIE